MTSIITDFVLMISSSISLTILAKATVILTLGLFAGALAVRAQASLRHLVFATTFAAVLALPLIVATVPDLPVPVPVEASAVSSRETSPSDAVRSASFVASDAPASVPAERTAQGWQWPSLTTVFLLVWIAGAFALMLSLTIDLVRVRHLRRHGLPSEQLRNVIDMLAAEAQVKPVDVMLHEKIQAPVTFGFFRPVVMLPADAENWEEADLRRALVHEFEHIRRGDWATQLAARVACSFYWFHPLVWMAWRGLCLEAERACDDAVVRTAESTEYAEQLVSLSRQLSAGRGQPVLGMAKRSDLATRVSSLLDTSRRRGRAGLVAAAFSVTIGAFVVMAIGPLRAVAQSSSAPVIDKQPLRSEVKFKTSNGDDDDDDDRGINRMDSALYKAAARNRVEMVKELIEAGANVNAEIAGDGTPLIAAARSGHLEMVRLLLERGAKPNIGVRGDGNALLNAAREGHADVVTLLLDRGADINAGVEGDGNALIMASGAGYTNIVTLLLDRGADIHKAVAGDENPIIKACEQGQLEVVKLLVARGADVNSRVKVEYGAGDKVREEYRTPLSMARKNGHTPVVEYLLSVGAKQ
jgi:beta-lactamase regulating signal transducer with metallopeptidase domain/ankyrin repeat protein